MKQGWEKKTIGEIATVEYGFTGKAVVEGFYRYVRITDIDNNGELSHEDKRYLAYSIEAKKFILNDNDILMARTGATFAKVLLYKDHEPSLFASYLIRINFKNKVLNRFYWYFSKSEDYWDQANNLSTGSAQPHFNGAALKKVIFPFPTSLSKQQQIVAILDKAFAAIDKAKANIEKNIENAKELFQSKLNDIFSQKGEGWEEKTLKEITNKIGSGATPRGGRESYKESGISLIRSMNVHDDGFRKKNLAFIDDEQASKLNNVTLEENDVLLNITGASVARCCIVDNNYLPARVNQHVSIIRLKNGILNPEFLHYALTSKQTKDKLLGIGEQGSTRQAITKAQIENFSIKFPIGLRTQTALVSSLNEIRSNSEKLVNSYNLKLISLEELKKSILQKAFAGELTEKDVAI